MDFRLPPPKLSQRQLATMSIYDLMLIGLFVDRAATEAELAIQRQCRDELFLRKPRTGPQALTHESNPK